MNDDLPRQAIIDEEHLRLLSIGYLISAGTTALFSLLGLMYVFLGIMIGTTLSKIPAQPGHEPPPAAAGWIFVVVGLAFFLLAVGFALAKFYAASCVKKRKSRMFCLVVAAISCLEMPYGTVLGVFAILALERDSIKRLFAPSVTAAPV
jgi:hypothetical protein